MKFKVCVQQYVEQIAEIEVEAEDYDAAINAALYGADDPLVKAEWREGDDCHKAEAYAVQDMDGATVWER